jgi:hypothetical protein
MRMRALADTGLAGAMDTGLADEERGREAVPAARQQQLVHCERSERERGREAVPAARQQQRVLLAEHKV